MAYKFNREQTFGSPQIGDNATKVETFKKRQTAPVRYSPAFIASTYLRLEATATTFAADSVALLTALSSVEDLHVVDWPRDYEVTINRGRKMLEQLALEIFYLDKHITVSFIIEDSDPYTTEYHIITSVIGEGFVHQCWGVNAWARWFNNQFNYVVVTPLSDLP